MFMAGLLQGSLPVYRKESNMLVETKAKVGVFSIALGAYLPQFPSLVPEFEAQYEAFKKLSRIPWN